MHNDDLFCGSCGLQQSVESSNQNINETPASNTKGKQKKRHIGLWIGAFVLALLIAGGVLYFKGIISIPFGVPSIDTISESCVRVNCYDASDELSSTGSGFCIFDEHIIVTNYHVIDGATARIDIDTEKGKTYDIDSILVYNEDRDLCILHIVDDKTLRPLKTGSTEKLKKGEDVLSISCPQSLLNTVTEGQFSGWLSENAGEVMQISAAISSGSSGGALFNLKHEVIGMTYASYIDGEDLNVAIPIENISKLWKSRSDKKAIAVEDFIEVKAKEIDSDAITMEQLLSNPAKYDGEEVTVMGFVSSVYWFGTGDGDLEIAEIIMVSDPEDIEYAYYDTEDMDFDFSDPSSPYQKDLKNSLQDSDTSLIFGTYTSSDEPDSEAATYVYPGDFIIVTGYFKYGNLNISLGNGEALTLSNCNFFSGDPYYYDDEPIEDLGDYSSFIIAVNNYYYEDLEDYYE